MQRMNWLAWLGNKSGEFGMSDLDLKLCQSIRLPALAASWCLTPLITTAALLGAPALATAAPIGPYRLAFIAHEGYSATSTSIIDYNNDVADSAAQNTDLPVASWYAIASVPGYSAVENITSCPGCDGAVPIYLVDGTFLANSVADLFAGDDSNFITEDQYGDEADNYYVWIGSNPDGSAVDGNELGTDFPVWTFSPGFSGDAGPWNSEDEFALYAISDVINAPEPASASLLAVGGLALAGVRRRRRR
jgi:hypothetical protein